MKIRQYLLLIVLILLTNCKFFNKNTGEKIYQQDFFVKEDIELKNIQINLSEKTILNENLSNQLDDNQKNAHHKLNYDNFTIKPFNLKLNNFQFLHQRKLNINFSPIIFNDRIIVNNDNNQVKCVNLKGEELWSLNLSKFYKTKKHLINYISIIGKKYLITHSSFGEILFFDIKNIDQKPEFKIQANLKEEVHSNIVFDENEETIYILTVSGNLYSLNLQGEVSLIKKNEKEPSIFYEYKMSNIFIDKDYIIFGNTNGEIFCLKKKDKTLLWKVDFNLMKGENSSVLSNFSYNFIEDDNNLIIASNLGIIACIEKQTSQIKWIKETYVNSEIVKNNNFIYFLDSNNTLIALRMQDGKIKWTNNLEKNKIYKIPKYLNSGNYKFFNVLYQAPMIIEHNIFLINYYGELLKIDINEGYLLEVKSIPYFLNSNLIFLNGEGYTINYTGLIFKTVEDSDLKD